jgi:hypothetical protein
MKNTAELLSEIKQSTEIKTFLSENNADIENLSLTEYLNILLEKKQVSRSEAIKKAELNYTYGYQMINGTRKPTKDKLLQLCFGLGATPDEANRVLLIADAGGLYSKNRRDCIIIFALEKGLSLTQANEMLCELGEDMFALS